MNTIAHFLNDFFALFFPELCAGCNASLVKTEKAICTACLYTLPYTNFHLDPNNRLARQLLGRIPFQAAMAFLYFNKGSRVQRILHQLKYNNKPYVGSTLGQMYGETLKKALMENVAEVIVPVPLHPLRLKQRGYNQSECFAKGLSKSLSIHVCTNSVKRKLITESQTKKSRYSRYENMQKAFIVKNPKPLIGKHILLVDDILTSGATIEACASELLKIPGTSISIATIAFTD